MFATYYYTNPSSPVGNLQQLIIRFSTFFFYLFADHRCFCFYLVQWELILDITELNLSSHCRLSGRR